MLLTLINLICSTVEALSCYLIMVSRSGRSKRLANVDILLVLFLGFCYSILNAKLPIGNLLGTILQFIWAKYCLQGKDAAKFLGYGIWFLFVMISDWSTMIGAELLHIVGSTPIMEALLEQTELRISMMLISKFLLFTLTITYIAYQQKHGMKRIPFTKVIPILFLLMLGSIFSAVYYCWYEDGKFSENIYRLVLVVPLFMIALFLFIVCLFYYLSQTNMDAYRYEQALQKDKLEERHYENMQLLEQELNNWKVNALKQLQILQCQISSASRCDLHRQEEVIQSLFQDENLLLTGNTIFDIVISQKIKLGQAYGISFQTNIQQIDAMLMEETDIVCLMSNLLDNACEAVEKLEPGERWIYLEIRCQDGCLLIKTENPCLESVIDSGNHLRTTKSNSKLHGHGINCMRSIVDKYQGMLEYQAEHNMFTMKIIMQMELERGK